MGRVPGTRVGIQANYFGLTALEGITGEDLAPLLMSAMRIAEVEALMEWPKDTHASVETIELQLMDVGAKRARVALVAGGQRLIEDPRNRSGKDYAPFIEFNGTKTAAPGTLSRAVIANDTAIKAEVASGIRMLIQDRLGNAQ